MMKPQMMITFMLLILSHLAAQNQKKRRLDVPYVVSGPNKPVKNNATIVTLRIFTHSYHTQTLTGFLLLLLSAH